MMETNIRRFESDEIEVLYDRKRCIHVAACIRTLPSVFSGQQRPWIQPGNASADAVAEAVMRCPSGALQFRRKDGGLQETPPGENTIRIEPGGPLYVRGEVVLTTPDDEVLLEDTRVALCRCGASSHKPLCDQSHEEIGFDDPGTFKNLDNAPKGPPEDVSGGPLRVLVRPNASFRFEGSFTLEGADESLDLGNASLCRCGHSGNKPFCDGTHKEIGFSTEEG